MTSSPDDGSSQWYIHWLLWRTFKPQYAVELATRLSKERLARLEKDLSTIRKALDDAIAKYS